MRIISYEIVGLNGREGKIRGDLAPDLNILTGRNGAGKTNILKLLWYVLSGNILIALREVRFQRVSIVTTLYEISIDRTGPATCRIEYESPDRGRMAFEDQEDEEEGSYYAAEDNANALLQALGGSVFFPTFRRIEGGFTLETEAPRTPYSAPSPPRKNQIEDALQALSRRLTNGAHVFVAAISTGDIVNLLLRRYTDLSEISNRSQQEASQNIITKIKDFKEDDLKSEDASIEINAATYLIDQIRNIVEKMEERRLEIMTPIEEVSEVVQSLFQKTTIRFGTRLSFGDAASAVNSTALSAGEKQMLSFICYNAFYRDSVIFIDEPELSLHVDWQRQLFPILQKQQATNQFVIATHSPFIFSKYPDKEININPDRGDGGD